MESVQSLAEFYISFQIKLILNFDFLKLLYFLEN